MKILLPTFQRKSRICVLKLGSCTGEGSLDSNGLFVDEVLGATPKGSDYSCEKG